MAELVNGQPDNQHPRASWKKKWGMDEQCRLGKRLAYLLRYGAAQEGLDVSESGNTCVFFLILRVMPKNQVKF